VAFRVEKADELALPLGVCSDGHRRRLHAVLVQASDDPVDVVDPVVDDVTLARLARIARIAGVGYQNSVHTPGSS
jgi:hypothetical protein